jgi:hypothetical protein
MPQLSVFIAALSSTIRLIFAISVCALIAINTLRYAMRHTLSVSVPGIACVVARCPNSRQFAYTFDFEVFGITTLPPIFHRFMIECSEAGSVGRPSRTAVSACTLSIDGLVLSLIGLAMERPTKVLSHSASLLRLM